MSVGYVYDFADLGLLLNLQPYFDRDLNPDDFFMEPFKAMRYPSMETGDLYGIPFAFVMSAFYYNETLFDVTGLAYPDESWTWENVREAGKRIAHDTDGDGVIDVWALESPSTIATDWVAKVHQFGGRVLTEDGKGAAINEPAAIAGLTLWADTVLSPGDPGYLRAVGGRGGERRPGERPSVPRSHPAARGPCRQLPHRRRGAFDRLQEHQVPRGSGQVRDLVRPV